MSTNKSAFRFTTPLTDGFEYRSQAELCGWPLVHIARGVNPETGRLRVARGIIAVGDIAIGGIALGGISAGILSLGGISLGSYALGGLALGGFAVGGIAVAICTAVGVIAVSPATVFGFLTINPHLTGIAAKIFGLIRKN